MLVGFLNVHKPSGCTSRDVVNQVQRLVRPAKIGHAGTLDPLAQGVLVMAVGAATRLIDRVQQMRKRYVGTFLLGRGSSTEDVEGQVWETVNARQPELGEIELVLSEFVGEIQQRPPAFSALKIQGQRAYDLARRGAPVELLPRTITIYDIRLVQYAYPELVLDIECGSGTYVRSLGRDIALRLGTEAVMSALTRMAIGKFTLDKALHPHELNGANIANQLLPARMAFDDANQVVVNGATIERIAHGQPIDPEVFGELSNLTAHGEKIACDAAGNLVAILELRDDGRYWPAKNFAVR